MLFRSLVMADDDSGHFPNGGIFSTTDRANYKVPATIVGKYNSLITVILFVISVFLEFNIVLFSIYEKINVFYRKKLAH